MPLNWVDWIILLFYGYALYDGWQRGFISLFGTFVSFLGSMWLALRYHGLIGNFLTTTFGLSPTWTDIIGYLGIAMISQYIIELLCGLVIARLPEAMQNSKKNYWFGSIMSLLNTVIVTAFFLVLCLALPLRGTFKHDIRSSVIGSKLVALTDQYAGRWTSDVQTIAQNATKFLTVEPNSLTSIPLDIGTVNTLSVSVADEQGMVTLVNHERTSRGVSALVVDNTMTRVAEAKSRDMFVRKYFSHVDPDGKTVFDHMTAAGVIFTIICENLAYAPDLASAHQGLMNSKGHRDNILDTRYRRKGIGVIDGGIYGKMFTQEFAD